MNRRTPVLPLAALAALALAGCGESAQEKATNTVCDARSDIAEQVDQLKSVTPASFSKDEVTQSLGAIRSDLSDIKGAQGELDGQRKQQVEQANQALETQMRSLVSQIASSGSAAGASDQLSSAFKQFADAYEQTLAPVDCN